MAARGHHGGADRCGWRAAVNLLFESFDICQILRPAGRTFVADERRPSDGLDVNVAEAAMESIGPGFGEGQRGELRQDVDSAGRDADLIHDRTDR